MTCSTRLRARRLGEILKKGVVKILRVLFGVIPAVRHDENVGRFCREIDSVLEIAVLIEIGFEGWNACYFGHDVLLFIGGPYLA